MTLHTETVTQLVVPADAHSQPLANALLRHVLQSAGAQRHNALLDFYDPLPAHHFDELEADIEHTLQASGRSLSACLRDFDHFAATRLEHRPADWFERPEALTAMQLNAALPGLTRRRQAQLRDKILLRAGAARDVLEVGCGSGYLSAELVDVTPDWQLTLADRSRAAVAFTEAFHRVRGTQHRVKCIEADVTRLPLSDAQFDVVIAADVLHHMADAASAVVELLRVLRPRGWLAISHPVSTRAAPVPPAFKGERDLLAFFERFGLHNTDLLTLRPDPRLDRFESGGFECTDSFIAVFQKAATL